MRPVAPVCRLPRRLGQDAFDERKIEIDKERIVVAVPEEVETGERGNVE